MNARSEALAVTARPARYGKQLVAHLGRRRGGEWSDSEGRAIVTIGSGRAELSCETGVLRLSVEGEQAEVPRPEDVVGPHLVRFGTRDGLHVHWVRANGEPGTEQHGTAEQ